MRLVAREKNISTRTINNTIHFVTSQIKDSKFIKEKFNPLWSGVLTVDGKSIKIYDHYLKETVKMVWICGIDFHTKDLPHYLLFDEEGKIDLVVFFKELKQFGYPLKVLISDDNHEILAAARFVYGDTFVFQLCVHHYINKLKLLFLPSSLQDRNDDLIELIKMIINSENKETFFRRLEFLMRNKHCFTKQRFRQIIFDDFLKHLESLITYIYYPEYIPKTNNEIENLFRQLNQRLKTIGRFYHHRYAADFLKAWALMRRFIPFTDCKKPNQHQNGKAPLELAGCNIEGIDYLKL